MERNYRKIEDTLAPGEEKKYTFAGDFFDIVYVSTALTDLEVKFYIDGPEQEWFNASEILPANTVFQAIGIRNTNTTTSVRFIGVVGREYFKTAKQSITIANELIGLIDRLNALVDDGIKGVLRSIGDAGDTPTNAAGYTLLKLLYDLRNALSSVATDKILTTPDNPPNLDVALSTRATETTLSGVKAQTDKLQFDANNFLRSAIAASEIQVPIDLQSILPKKAELYGADETVAQSISLDVGGFKLVEVVCQATAATTFTVEYSFDNVNWFTYYTSAAAETSYNDVFWTAAQYIRVSSAAAGAAGDTVSLVIGAKP